VLGVEGVATVPGFAAEVAERAFGPGGRRALSAAMAVSAIGVCAVNVIVTPTIFVAMARSGLFFRSFARLNARGAPTLALAAQLGLALGYLAWAHSTELFGWTSDLMDVSRLTDSVVFAEWVFHGLTAWGLIRLRARRPELDRPYRSFAFPLAPAIYLAVAIGVLGGNVVRAEPSLTGVGLGVIAAGALVYGPWRAFLRRA
jgi:APA family basic amino acid/polyamine antiporter